MHYWSSILGILRKTVGAEVIVTAVPGTGSIASRAEQLDRFLQIKAFGRGINFMAHSMGGLDCRHLITHLKPADYAPLSLTTIATPHRGSAYRCLQTKHWKDPVLKSIAERSCLPLHRYLPAMFTMWIGKVFLLLFDII